MITYYQLATITIANSASQRTAIFGIISHVALTRLIYLSRPAQPRLRVVVDHQTHPPWQQNINNSHHSIHSSQRLNTMSQAVQQRQRGLMGPPAVPTGIPVRSGAAAATKQALLSPPSKHDQPPQQPQQQRMSMPPPRGLTSSSASSTSSRPSLARSDASGDSARRPHSSYDERIKTPLQESHRANQTIDAQFDDLLVSVITTSHANYTEPARSTFHSPPQVCYRHKGCQALHPRLQHEQQPRLAQLARSPRTSHTGPQS